MRTALLRGIGGYRFGGLGEDWDMFLRLGEVTRFANLPQLCYYYRLHGHNASTSHQRFTQERIDYACRCAAVRRSGAPEPTMNEYREELRRSGMAAKLYRRLDAFSLAHFSMGRNLILNGRPVVGYLHLLVGMAAGPWRVVSRLGKALSGLRSMVPAWWAASPVTPPFGSHDGESV
jgi:hypothetical protein